MAAILTDNEIALLLADPKPLYLKQIAALKRPRKGIRPTETQVAIDVDSSKGRRFRLIAKKMTKRPNGFSIIMAYLLHGKYTNLIRCNGFHKEHTNEIEKRNRIGVQVIPANTCHVHILTERYQLEGLGENYAVPTMEYTCFSDAIDYFCENFGCYRREGGYTKEYPLF